MKDKIDVSAADIAKGKSVQNPNEPKFTEDQPDSSKAASPDQKISLQKDALNKPQLVHQEAQPLEAAKGNDELMSQPPQPAEPYAKPAPKIDANLKLARRETAQEEVHEVMTRREASKLVVKEKPKTSQERPSLKKKID